MIVCFVMSKAKVASLKSTSILRLELMAATVGLQIAETAGKTLVLPKEKRIFWSDIDVPHWARRHSRQFKPFLSNRVGEIHTKTFPAEWHYTSSKANPADKLSREMKANSLPNDHTL